MTEAPVRRVDRTYRGKPTHHYVDTDGRRVPGVTTLLDQGMPKPALIHWAANATADYAVDHWDELSDLGPAARVKKLRSARFEDRDAAARRGTEVHQLGERLVRGEPVHVPDELAGHVDSYVSWLDRFAPDPVLVEATVFHTRFRYAGTLDLVADMACPMPGCSGTCRWLLDLKTTRSGVYGEAALQLAAYAHAEGYVDADGQAQPMPHVDHCGVVWIRADGADLVPVRADDDVFLDFRYVTRVARAAEEMPGYVGEAVTVEEAVPA